MKSWKEESYMRPNNILRVRTRKNRAGERLQSAGKLSVEPVKRESLAVGDWAVALFRHNPGVGEVTGIVRRWQGRKVLSPVSYVFNPKLARWKPGSIDLQRLSQVLRLKGIDLDDGLSEAKRQALERVRAIILEGVPWKLRHIERFVRLGERYAALRKRGVRAEFTFDRNGFVRGLNVKRKAGGIGSAGNRLRA